MARTQNIDTRITLSGLLVTAVACGTAQDPRPVVVPTGTPSAPAPPQTPEDSLVASLTREEKIALVSGTGFETTGVTRTRPDGTTEVVLPKLRMTDGPVGVRTGRSTAFPSGTSMAATFDPALIERLGHALARETKGHGKNVLLAPAMNLARTPLNGRNFEYFGEDPWLAARTAVAYVKGVQAEGVLATIKHYAVNNQETERMTISAEVDERALHELYFPAFEASVKEGQAWAVMCAYNRINGIYACEHPYLLKETLKERWGFRGLVMSDWGATHSVAPAMKAGLDLEMPGQEQWKPDVVARALDAGELTLAELDDLVRRQVRVIQALGITAEAPEDPAAIDTAEHRALNRELARAGVVLLKNDAVGGVGGAPPAPILPLARAQLRRVAVVGPRGGQVDGGGGSAYVNATNPVSLVAALGEALGAGVRIDYAPGEITAEMLELVPSSALTPPAGHSGPGLLGEYFANTERTGTPALARVDPVVDFRWELAAPAPGLPVDNVSVRWTGKLTPPKTGTYALALRSDDGSRLTLDGKLLIDNWGNHPPTLKLQEVELVGGRAYDLVIDYFEGIIGASVQLLWKQVDTQPLQKVRDVARGADVVLVAVGDAMGDETEGNDRTSLALPGKQEELLRIAREVNPRTVVITTAGAPLAMDWLGTVPAVLHAWFPGQEAGHALVDVLLGEVSPSGRLPITFPKRLEDGCWHGRFPGANGKVEYSEGVLVGYRWFDTKRIEPLFPFGYGLSYTRFEYSGLSVSAPDAARRVRVALQLKNTGDRAGAEVVQLYVHDDQAAVLRPEQELKGFAKVTLAPGETRAVELTLDARSFAYWDVQTHDWRHEPGSFELRVGASSRDIRLRQALTVP